MSVRHLLGRAVEHVIASARTTPRGRDAVQSAVLLAGTLHVARATSPRDALDRLDQVTDAARRARGD